MPTTRSPLRYPGGKTALAPLLLEVMRSNGLLGGEYAEPYAGGAGAALELLLGEQVERIWINDADYCIFSFWNACIKDVDKFVEAVRTVKLHLREWHRQRDIYTHPQAHSSFDVGFATFYLNRCNHSGILMNAGPIGGLQQTGKWKIDARFNAKNLEERIRLVSSYKERIHVTNLDAIDFFKKTLIAKSNLTKLLVYLDPPYYVRGRELYLNHYVHADHVRLADYISHQNKFKWLISYDDCSEIREIYSEFNQVQLSLNYSANGTKKGKELVIYNDQLAFPHYFSNNGTQKLHKIAVSA